MSDLNRREFIRTAGVAVSSAATAGLLSEVAEAASISATGLVPVSLIVNGRTETILVEPRTTLLDAIRNQLGLHGTKKGCDRGECGACTVQIEGRRVLSCMSLAIMQDGKALKTIEGLAKGDELHPLQAAFIEHDGLQCGFCTPGQIMSGVAAIEEAKAGWPSAATADLSQPFGVSDLSSTEIRERMSGNLCRAPAIRILFRRSALQQGAFDRASVHASQSQNSRLRHRSGI